MRYRTIVAFAVGMTATLAFAGQTAVGQQITNNGYQRALPAAPNLGAPQATRTAYAEDMPAPVGTAAPRAAEQSHADPFGDDASAAQQYASSVYGDGSCVDGTCDAGACCQSSGPACSHGSCFAFADYLSVRSSFSEATEFLEIDNSQTGLNDRNERQFDFDFDSSFRVGGGYRLCGCGDEIRFTYTSFDNDAEDEQAFDTDIIVPFEVVAEPGGRYIFNADVNVDCFDLEYRKTIPLGGPCCDCGDACGGGCGNGCGSGCQSCCCPAWDITWSGGVRVADVDWQRSYFALGAVDNLVSDAITKMDFKGAGAKVGLEGRRYFFHDGWLSMYLKGDISVLFGDLDFEANRFEEGGSAPDQVIRQTMHNRQLIPVTEIEAGLSAQVCCQGRLSAGYMLSAWHDLGYRDEFQLDNVFPLQYDDANILGFDGFFARFEYGF